MGSADFECNRCSRNLEQRSIRRGAKPAGSLSLLSYSRDDLNFADQLEAALQSHKYDVLIDRQGISGGEDWSARLGGLIREVDTVIFVLSPSSARADLCKWEVEEASRLGKRIIPVPCRPLGDATVPTQLSALNYIFFYAEPRLPGSGSGTGLARLLSALAIAGAVFDATGVRRAVSTPEAAQGVPTNLSPSILLGRPNPMPSILKIVDKP